MKLPGSMRVIERGWLSANNVVLHDRKGATVIDSGYGAHAPQTLSLIDRALQGGPLARLVNTHCHSDHMGGNAAIKTKYGCRTSVPAGEAPVIDRWDEQALILSVADQRAERFRYDDTFADGDVLAMGGLDWRVIAAPGHDPNAVVFYSPESRTLISGDALWEHGFGAVFPQLFGRETALAETRATLERIAALDIEAIVPGHGKLFGNAAAALERAFYRLEGYEEDITRLARHCVKVAFSFAMMEKRAMPLAEVPAYLARVPILADINRRYLGMPAAEFARWIVGELERAGAVRCAEGMVLATGS